MELQMSVVEEPVSVVEEPVRVSLEAEKGVPAQRI